MRFLFLFALLFFLLVGHAEELRNSQEEFISAKWIYNKAKFEQTEVIEGGLLIRIKYGWYTYAKDPGDSGMPPRIKFLDAEGIEVSGPFFPPSKEYKHSSGVSYGYDGNLLIKFKIKKISNKAFSGFKIVYEGLMCNGEECKPFDLIVKVEPPEELKSSEDCLDWEKILHESGWGKIQK